MNGDEKDVRDEEEVAKRQENGSKSSISYFISIEDC